MMPRVAKLSNRSFSGRAQGKLEPPVATTVLYCTVLYSVLYRTRLRARNDTVSIGSSDRNETRRRAKTAGISTVSCISAHCAADTTKSKESPKLRSLCLSGGVDRKKNSRRDGCLWSGLTRLQCPCNTFINSYGTFRNIRWEFGRAKSEPPQNDHNYIPASISDNLNPNATSNTQLSLVGASDRSQTWPSSIGRAEAVPRR